MYKIKILLCSLLLLSTFAEVFPDIPNATSISSQRIAEGGALPQHQEDKLNLNQDSDVNKLNSTFLTKKNINNTQATNDTNIEVPSDKFTNSSGAKPIIENSLDFEVVVPKKNDDKQSVGKKGVSLSGNDSATHGPFEGSTSLLKNTTSSPILIVNTSTTKLNPLLVPKKPLFVKHDAVPVKLDPVPETPNILEKKTNRANYVIPIVAVILSVPLVAIIISVLYRRGTDWWQHRNYRRMDFLIEGMYNN